MTTNPRSPQDFSLDLEGGEQTEGSSDEKPRWTRPAASPEWLAKEAELSEAFSSAVAALENDSSVEATMAAADARIALNHHQATRGQEGGGSDE